jgi:membrane-associated phospholipid phosphatase
VIRAPAAAALSSIRPWEAASLVFFGAVLLVSPLVARAGHRRILKVQCGAVAGLAVTAAIAMAPYLPLVHDWFGPPALLLMGYWISGWLFVAPRSDQERRLQQLDDCLTVLSVARGLPRPVVEFLELSYVGIYPLIPVALVTHLTLTPDPSPERFWSVLLITDYICFIVLAWVQTRPPRVLETGEPWRSTIRSFNLRLIGAASIQVNTFPSGHAAEALAAALLVLGAPLPIVLLMFVNALAVSAAAVLGRYHYAADAIAGWAVAVLVWMVF